MDDFITINTKTCNRDGICEQECPMGLIRIQKGDFPKVVAGADQACIRCGHCVVVCPTQSLIHREFPVDECPPMDKSLHLTQQQSEQFLKGRRSVRLYKDTAVSREVLLQLFDTARYAPTGHNRQKVEWMVLGDREELARLSGIVVDWMHWTIENKPDFAGMLKLESAVRRWEQGVDVILRRAPIVIVAHAEETNGLAVTDCSIALTYLDLAANGMGLGCCWAGFFNLAANTFPPMSKALSLPEGHRSFGSMMVGYPKFSYYRLPIRKQPAIIWRL